MLDREFLCYNSFESFKIQRLGQITVINGKAYQQSAADFNQMIERIKTDGFIISSRNI